MIDVNFPSSTNYGKVVPKNAFYKHLEVNAKMKQHFVDDVDSINWLYKIAPSTVNVADGKSVHEIVVFSVGLKSKKCPDDVFIFIEHSTKHRFEFKRSHTAFTKKTKRLNRIRACPSRQR